MGLESCKHGHAAEEAMLLSLPDYQAGEGRHKCAICAFNEGLKGSGNGALVTCDHGSTAPANIIEGLQDSQAGAGRHKCTVCAYSAGLSQSILVKEAVELAEDVTEIKAKTPTETVKQQLVAARIGQGQFRWEVLGIEPHCRLTGVSDPQFLIAGHIKPWRMSDNAERLDKHNGLMLSPHVDKLFDRGYISFLDDGTVLISGAAQPVMKAWLLNVSQKVGVFTAKQCKYLKWHRENVFKG